MPAGMDTLFPSVPKSTQALKMGTIQGSLWAVGGRGSRITAQRMETLDSLGEKTCHLLSPERGNRPKLLNYSGSKGRKKL